MLKVGFWIALVLLCMLAFVWRIIENWNDASKIWLAFMFFAICVNYAYQSHQEEMLRRHEEMMTQLRHNGQSLAEMSRALNRLEYGQERGHGGPDRFQTVGE
jgi:hypothetical protein